MKASPKKQFLETSGFSMWPFLRLVDRIIVEDVSAKELNPGDIIVYKVDAQPVCHRLVAKRKSAGKYLLFTRGDYVPSWKTERVIEEQLSGRVCGIVRSSQNRGGSRLVSLKGAWQAMRAVAIITVFPLVVIILVNISKILRKR